MDWRIVIESNAQLIAEAERRGMDEPPLAVDGPAHRAAAAALECLEALSPSEKNDPKIAGYLWINRANALRLCGPGTDAQALQAYDRALCLDPENGWWWYDLGLLHKWRGRFSQGYDANLKARARVGDEKPILWNLAICATALGDGNVAAGVWKHLGMPASLDAKSGMPFVDGLPPMLIRVLSRSTGYGGSSMPERAAGFELVWVAPLSPCHGVVQTPTFRDAPIDFGDLVLWDGAPVASRADGQPVFALLEILRRGDEHRFPFIGLSNKASPLERLRTALPPEARLFLQQEHIELSCPHCANGSRVDDHEHPAAGPLRGKLVAPSSISLEAIAQSLDGAQRDHGLVVAMPALYEALGQTKRAGQAQQAWRGIERKAAKA